MNDGEVKVAIVGTRNGHAVVFGGFLNGWSPEAPTPEQAGGYFDPYYHFYQYQRAEQALASGSPVVAPGARVTKIWSPDEGAARMVARACKIDEVAGSLEAACSGVDAVLVLDGDPVEHERQAAAALDAGLPTFVDKPMATDVNSCLALYERARDSGAPLFSGSGLRWSKELLIARREFDEGFNEKVEAIYVKVPNRPDQYAIHAVEMCNVLLGADVRDVRGHDAGGRAVALLSYGSGQSAVLETLHRQARPSYCVVCYGQRHTRTYHLYDTALPALGLLQGFLDMVRTGTPPVPQQEVLRMMEVTLAVQQACASGGSVQLAPYEAPRAGAPGQ
ncbi:MAG TPA: Gfo/Idh/MocA family oxidoreductase [Acidimicrobiales bacterium]|nr:Gfo/Idh/MocA family oxidoreductase [Acidimicrobiales bacterium]